MSPLISFMSRKATRILLVTLVGFSALALVLLTVMQILLARVIRAGEVEAAAAAALGRPVVARSVSPSAIYGIVVRGVVVGDSPGSSTLLAADEVRIRPSWWQLLHGRVRIVKITVLDARLAAVNSRDSEGRRSWNWQRLFAELNSRPAVENPPPLHFRNLRITVQDTPQAWNGWCCTVKSMRYSPSSAELRATITEWNGRECLIDGDGSLDRSECEFEFEKLPPALAALFTDRIAFARLDGRARIAWRREREDWRVDVSGRFTGTDVRITPPRAAAIKLSQVRTERFAGFYESAGRRWEASFDDLKIGVGRRDGFLHLDGNLHGQAGREVSGKIEWDGPVETLLAVVPASFTNGFAAYQPHGPLGGYVQFTLPAGATEVPADRLAIGLSPRGLSLTIPRQKPIAGVPFTGTVREIRGRIRLEGPTCHLDGVSLAVRQNPLTISGTLDRAAPDAAYDLALSSPGFDAADLAAFLPPGVKLDGRVALDLHAAPGALTGDIAFLGNQLRQDSYGPFTLTGGSVNLGIGRRLRLERVAVASGGGRILIDGLFDAGRGAHAQPLDLSIGLDAAGLRELQNLNDAFGEKLPFRVQAGRANGELRLRGTTQHPSLGGQVELKDVQAVYAGLAITAGQGSLRIDSSLLSAAELSANAGEGRITVRGGESARSAQWRLEFDRLDATLLTPFFRDAVGDLTAAGPTNGALIFTRRDATYGLEGQIALNGNTFTYGPNLRFQNARGTIRFHPDHLLLDRLTATMWHSGENGGEALLNGVVPLADSVAYRFELKLGRTRLDDLQRFYPEGFTASGQAGRIALTLTGPRRQPVMHGTFLLDGASVKFPFLTRNLTEITGELSVAADSFHAENLSFKTGHSRVLVSGAIENVRKPRARRLRLSTENASLEELIDLVPAEDRPLPRGMAVSGALSIEDLSIDGPLDAAEWSGRIRVAGGGASLPGLKRDFTGVNGEIVFEKRLARATSLSGRIGASAAHLEGQMDLAPPYTLDLRMAIKDADVGDLFAAIPRSAASDVFTLNGRGTVVCRLRYVNGQVDLAGTLTDGRIEGVGVPFEDLAGGFRYFGPRQLLSVTDLNGRWAEGQVTGGDLQVTFSEQAPTFALAARVDGADLGAIVRSAGFVGDGYQGTVRGTLTVSGTFGRKESLGGNCYVEIDNGRFAALAPLDAISRTLRLDFFSRGTYEKVRGRFLIERGMIKTQDPEYLRFYGANYTLEVRGYTTLTGECVYNFVAGIAAGLTGHALNTLQVGKLFALSGKGGVIQSSGTITGRIDRPRITTDLGILNIFS